jgi:hypothetical protein
MADTLSTLNACVPGDSDVESLVLVDRLCFLLDIQDIKFAALMPLFDARISPRAFAMIAVR